MSNDAYIKIGPVADSVPFDNENEPNCALTGETTQEVIEELCLNNPACGLVSVQVVVLPAGNLYTHSAQLVSQTPAFLRSLKVT